MKKYIPVACLLFCGMILTLSPAFCADYFVASSGGSNTYSKTENDINHPWATLEYAMTQLSAGDTLNIRSGNYSSVSSIHFSVSGTNEDPVIIRGYPEDENMPVINGTISGTAINAYTFWLDGSAYLTLQGLEFKECRFFIGYDPSGGSSNKTDHITVAKCNLLNTNDVFYESRGSIIIGNSEYTTIRNCEISSGGGINILMWSNADYVKIENNFIHGGYHGIYSKHGSVIGHHSYQNNIIKDVRGYYSICINANHTLVHNNLIFQTVLEGGGIRVHTNSWPSDHATITHNTLYNLSHMGLSLLLEDGEYPSGTDIKYNVIYNSGKSEHRSYFVWEEGHENTSDYNVIYHSDVPERFAFLGNRSLDLSTWIQETGQDNNSIHAPPIFQNFSGNLNQTEDFALTSASPGYDYCPDNTDVGADIGLVGVIEAGDSPGNKNTSSGCFVHLLDIVKR